MYHKTVETMRDKLTAARLWPLEAQAELSNEVLEARFETVLPWAMEAAGIDLWFVMGKENCLDPVMKTLFTWDMPNCRRISILAFHYDSVTRRVRRMSVGNQSPEMSKFYENVQQPGEELWACVGRLVTQLAPRKIGVQQSRHYGFCDGLTLSLQQDLLAALTEQQQALVCSAQEISVRWLQRVTPLELTILRTLSELTQDITHLTFAPESITVGKTTTTDLEWLMRNTMSLLGFGYWFGPDIDLQRRGNSITRVFGEVIAQGDLLHCDVGVYCKYIALHTDMQWLCYIRHPGEEHAPRGLVALLEKGNRFQDIVAGNFAYGRAGNDVFAASLEQAKAEGLKPMLYTHPLGTFGHGAGTTVGQYDHQSFIEERGERPLENKTCYALELNIHDTVPEWDNQEVFAYLEEDIYFDQKVEFVRGRQTQLIEI